MVESMGFSGYFKCRDTVLRSLSVLFREKIWSRRQSVSTVKHCLQERSFGSDINVTPVM